jgi:hypothetical protein
MPPATGGRRSVRAKMTGEENKHPAGMGPGRNGSPEAPVKRRPQHYIYVPAFHRRLRAQNFAGRSKTIICMPVFVGRVGQQHYIYVRAFHRRLRAQHFAGRSETIIFMPSFFGRIGPQHYTHVPAFVCRVRAQNSAGRSETIICMPGFSGR